MSEDYATHVSFSFSTMMRECSKSLGPRRKDYGEFLNSLIPYILYLIMKQEKLNKKCSLSVSFIKNCLCVCIYIYIYIYIVVYTSLSKKVIFSIPETALVGMHMASQENFTLELEKEDVRNGVSAVEKETCLIKSCVKQYV